MFVSFRCGAPSRASRWIAVISLARRMMTRIFSLDGTVHPLCPRNFALKTDTRFPSRSSGTSASMFHFFRKTPFCFGISLPNIRWDPLTWGRRNVNEPCFLLVTFTSLFHLGFRSSCEVSACQFLARAFTTAQLRQLSNSARFEDPAEALRSFEKSLTGKPRKGRKGSVRVCEFLCL